MYFSYFYDLYKLNTHIQVLLELGHLYLAGQTEVSKKLTEKQKDKCI